MVKNSLSKSQLAIVIGVMVVVGLVAGVIGSQVTNSVTGNVVLSNNAAGSGTYRIRPEGTLADTWIPFKDGSIYLTTNSKDGKSGDLIIRTWSGNDASGNPIYKDLMTIGTDGRLYLQNDAMLSINGYYMDDAKSIDLNPSVLSLNEIKPNKDGTKNYSSSMLDVKGLFVGQYSSNKTSPYASFNKDGISFLEYPTAKCIKCIPNFATGKLDCNFCSYAEKSEMMAKSQAK